MGDRAYDDRRASRGDYTEYYVSRSRSRPRYDDHNQNRSSRDLVLRRSPDRDRDVEIVRYDDQKRRSRSVSRRRRDSDDHHHRRHHHEHDREYETHKKVAVEHHSGKNIAATLLGGIVGGQAGRKASDGSRLAAAVGVVVGAWGGHELEKSWETHEAKEKARRYSNR